MKIYCRDPHHRLVGKGKSNIWALYDVDFNRTLDVGDVETVAVVWEVSDKSGNFVPFISAVVEQPTERLTLTLDASSIKEGIAKVFVDTSSHLGAQFPYDTKEMPKEDSGIYTLAIDEPKLLHCYQMRWVMVN